MTFGCFDLFLLGKIWWDFPSTRSESSGSGGTHDAQLFTNDREKLPAALGHDVSHQSAHAPEIASSKPVQQEIAPKQEHSYGHGISL